jgi:hypothetical protein
VLLDYLALDDADHGPSTAKGERPDLAERQEQLQIH